MDRFRLTAAAGFGWLGALKKPGWAIGDSINHVSKTMSLGMIYWG
jgi:hypothetical protein